MSKNYKKTEKNYSRLSMYTSGIKKIFHIDNERGDQYERE